MTTKGISGPCYYGWDEEIQQLGIEWKNKPNCFVHYNRPAYFNTSSIMSWSEILSYFIAGKRRFKDFGGQRSNRWASDYCSGLELENLCLQLSRIHIGCRNIYDDLALLRHVYEYFEESLSQVNPSKLIIKNIPHLCFDYLFCIACRNLGIKSEAWALLRGVSYQWSRKPLQEQFVFHIVDPVSCKVAPTNGRPFNNSELGGELLFTHALDLKERARDIDYGKKGYGKVMTKSMSDERKICARQLDNDLVVNGTMFLAELLREYNLYAYTSEQIAETKGGFLFLPLHKQPEMSTNPSAQSGWSQSHLISKWSYICHKIGIKLVVKEHPHLFRWGVSTNLHFINSEHFPREPGIYRRLSELHNVMFAKIELDSLELVGMNECLGVITGEGTLGASSALAGKPTFVHGQPWYRYLNNVVTLGEGQTISIPEIIRTLGMRTQPPSIGTIRDYSQWYSEKYLYSVQAKHMKDIIM